MSTSPLLRPIPRSPQFFEEILQPPRDPFVAEGVKTVRCLGASLIGAGAELVTIEARFDKRDRERTEVVLTGLPDPVLRESKGRLECALTENGFGLPQGRLFLNLVPAARRKSGEILDLPLALAAAAATGHFDEKALRRVAELGASVATYACTLSTGPMSQSARST